MTLKSLLSSRYTQVYLLIATFVLMIATLNVLINQHSVQKRIAKELKTRAGIELKFDDITLQLFTGTVSGKTISLTLKKNGLYLSLKRFHVNFNPVFFLLGQIKINTVMAEEVLLDTSGLVKPKLQSPPKPLPNFLRSLRLKRALIHKITWRQGNGDLFTIDHLKIMSRFGGLITKSPAIMQMNVIHYSNAKLDVFVDEIIQDGFFIFDFSKPRILDESRLVSKMAVKNILLGFKKRKKNWLTNRGWDEDLEPVLHRHYGAEIPGDRSYLYIDSVNLNLAKNELNTVIRSFEASLHGGSLSASGQWNHSTNNLGFRLEAKHLPLSKLPLGQSQLRTAFKTVDLKLNVKGTARTVLEHNLAITLEGALGGNLVNPPAGDLNALAAGTLKNSQLNLAPIRMDIGQGELVAKGTLDLKKLTTNTTFSFTDVDIQTVLRLFSAQNIPAVASGSGSVSGQIKLPKVAVQVESQDAMYEFLHFGAARAQLLIENRNLKLDVTSSSSSVGESQLNMTIRNVFDPFDQDTDLKTTHQNINIAKLLNTKSMDGKISGTFHLSRKQAVVTAKGDFAAENFTFFEVPIGNLKTSISLNRKHLSVAPITIDLIDPQMQLAIPKGVEFDFDESGYRFAATLIPSLKINGRFKKSDRQHLELDFAAQDMPLKIFTSLIPLSFSTSAITGQIKAVYDIYSPIDSRWQGQFSKIEIVNRDGTLKLMRPGGLEYISRAFVFRNFDVELGRGRFTLNGPLGLEKNSNLKIKGAVDFNLISDFNPFIAESDNPIEVDLTWRGDVNKPLLYGKVVLKNDTVVFRKTQGDFEDMNGTIRMDGPRIHFDTMKLVYDDAPVALNGWIHLDNELITGADLTLMGREVPVHMNNGFNALMDLDLKLTGTGRPVISGSVNIVDGQFVREFGLNNFILKPVSLDDDEESGFGFLPPQTVLNLDVKNTGDFVLKSTIAKLDMNANFDIRGHLAAPLLDGQIDILSGEINAFGVDFEDATGYVLFRSGPGINPSISLTAKKEIQEYEVLARISGQLNNMKLRFSSTPSLDHREILSVLYYGQTPDQLVGERRRQFTQTAAVTQLASVLSRPIYKISGLDVVEVHSRQERANETVQRLSVGKRISSRFNLNFTADLGIEDPERAFEAQFQILDNFYLIAAKDIGDRNRYRFDLSFRFEVE